MTQTVDWREELKAWILQRELTIAEFARQIGIPRPTVGQWWTRQTTPVLKWQIRVFEVTGIAISDETRRVSRAVMEQKRSPDGLPPEFFLIKGLAPIILRVCQYSQKAERDLLRRFLGEEIEDLQDGVRGIYSEQARENMLEERRIKQERRERQKANKEVR